jgi:hypothetical protein
MAVLLQMPGRLVVMDDACNEAGAPKLLCNGAGELFGPSRRPGRESREAGGGRQLSATRHSNNNSDRQPQRQRTMGIEIEMGRVLRSETGPECHPRPGVVAAL